MNYILKLKGELRIAIIGNPVTSGSNEVFLKKFLKILSPISRKIYVISHWQSQMPEIEVIKPGRFISEKFAVQTSFGRILRNILLQLAITKKLLKLGTKPRVVILFPLPMIIPIFLLKLLRRKVIFFAAGRLELFSSGVRKITDKILACFIKLAKRIVFSLSDSIIAESENLVNWLGLTGYEHKIFLGQTFVDTTLFQPRSKLHQRESIVGYIGVFHESKGAINFIKSIPYVLKEHPDARFLVGGAGPDLSLVIEAAEALCVGEKLELIKWIPYDEVPTYLNQLKLLVLPSKSEGLPNIILEAMACGTPVLATQVGAIPDIIKEGRTGFLLKDSTTTSISQGIIRALNSPDLENISTNSRRLIERSFNYESAVKRYIGILENLS